ncbi:MAG: glutamate-5-semialdehyde dehydrogenase [Alphaproteobacteria bacterium]|nr:glutamate-5-semialdehyde dehydrogenase [Alphaproteobacteria bacterium]
MSAPLTASTDTLAADMRAMGIAARQAARALMFLSPTAKTNALHAAAAAVRAATDRILAANKKDVEGARAHGATPAFVDRLALSPKAIDAMAHGIDVVADIDDPVGAVEAEWTRPNGLKIARIRVPIGVVGIIYESRPNVTADAAALSIKAGNAAILRCGSEALHSAVAIHEAISSALAASNLPRESIQIVHTPDRAAVGHMLAGLDGSIDVIVPRGGKSLVGRVQKEARVPVLAHLDGNCHVYVDASADIEKAKHIVLNAKMRRVSVCGAAEKLLVDRAGVDKFLKPLVQMLLDANCEIRGDAPTQAVDSRVKSATEDDWYTEYLDAIMAVRVVDGVSGAIAHIAKYGSAHTDAIVAEDASAIDRFLKEVDSAIVLANASTQFADGAEFGFGAEIGIATGRLHARGPVGARELTTTKYVVRGDGQIRP